MALALVGIDPHPVLRAIRATADVVLVDEDEDGFCASVVVRPGGVPVARLSTSLRGAPHEGEVLNHVMLRTTGLHGPGVFLFVLSPDGVLVR